MLTLLTSPAFEPVSLAAVKLAARIDGNELDGLLPTLIVAARQMAEQECRRLFVAQTWRVELPDWPAADQVLPIYGATGVAISYGSGSSWTNLAGSAFSFGPSGSGTVVAPAVDTSWPELPAVAAGTRVRIDVTAGAVAADQADATAATPASVQLWIQAQVAYWIRNPEAGTEKVMAASPFLGALLDPHRVY